MKRRDFIKTIGVSLLSIPRMSEANFNKLELNHLRFKQYKTGFQTGFKNIDKRLSELSNGDLFVVAARPYMGKSIFVRNIVNNISNNYRVPIGCFYGHNQYKRNHKNSIDEIKRINNTDIILNFICDITLDELLVKAIHLVHTHGVKLLVIDSLENIYDKDKGFDHETSLPFIKKLAVDLDVPVIVTCGLNRNLENMESKYPCLTDLDNYQIFDTYADSILYLYRHCVYIEHCKDTREVVVTIDKKRYGRIGMTSLRFDRDFARFTVTE